MILSLILFWFAHFWFPWLIVATVQIPCAMACSIWSHVGVRKKSRRETYPALTEPPSTLADQTDASDRSRFNDILYKACALEVSERYPTAADLLEWQRNFPHPFGA